MAVSGDYVTPTLNGLVLREAAAAVLATALAIDTFGLNNFTGRWWPAFTGLLGSAVHLVRRPRRWLAAKWRWSPPRCSAPCATTS